MRLSQLNKIGKHRDTPDNKFDPKQLKIGIDTELEHTDSKESAKESAKEIAKDHLSELPDYYTRLKKMEGSSAPQKPSCCQRS